MLTSQSDFRWSAGHLILTPLYISNFSTCPLKSRPILIKNYIQDSKLPYRTASFRKWHKDIDFWKSNLPSVIFTSFKVILLGIFRGPILFVNSFGSKWSFSKFFVFDKCSHCPIVLSPTNSSGVNLNFVATTFMEKQKIARYS